MAKKKNYKRAFPAYRMSPNTFQVTNPEGILKPGQKVLINQETDEPILHFATGKEIGKVEHKFGIGNVISDNKPKGTVIVQVGDETKKQASVKFKMKAPLNATAVVDEAQLLRIASVKGIACRKTCRKKKPQKYIAKIIE